MSGISSLRSVIRDSIRNPWLRQSAARIYKRLLYREMKLQSTLSGQTCGGYVDVVDAGRIQGWAVDMNAVDRPVEIEVWAGSTRLSAVKADKYRRDLQQAGFGDGRHAFFCELPPTDIAGPRPVSVKVQGTEVRLPYNGQTTFEVEPPPLIKYIAADIVNNCNLRCPFCVVDYSDTSKTELMSEDAFKRLIGLIRSVPTAGFWLSCLHEPTLHPRLNDFIELIPADCRQKVWFTTNLAKPLSDETFLRWARSGMHHINVSLDTMNADLFAVLRKFGRYPVFKDNLDRMAAIFREHPNAPKLRYITMAFRSNVEEIPRIVEHCHEHWLSSENEIRYTFNVEHITDDFRKEHYLHKEEWPSLTARLAEIPYHYVVVYPPDDGYEETIAPSANYFELKKATQPGMQAPQFERPLELRARPNGTLVVVGKENLFSVNVKDLDDPVEFFRKL